MMLKVLLSPAKSISKEPVLFGSPTRPIHEKMAVDLIAVLKKKTPQELQDLMSISPALSDLNWSRYQDWNPLQSNSNVMQPAMAFTGEVYKGFDATSFDEEDYAFAQQTIKIISGLYGFLRPLDGIAPYRLEMGTKLKIDKSSKNLYEYWREMLTESMISELNSDDVVLNLASLEYAKAINFKAISNKIITPVFKDFKNGKLKTIMMYAKRARGSMARAIVKKRIDKPNDLKLLEIDGYSYDERLSSENEWVFTR
jgi:cytoplasmic iron level regulating protein YaaA (DUF328/UPF0246 family)